MGHVQIPWITFKSNIPGLINPCKDKKLNFLLVIMIFAVNFLTSE